MSVRMYVHVCVFIGCCLATKCLNLNNTQSGMGRGDNEAWQWVARGNIQQISFGLMLFHQRREDMTSRRSDN